MSIDAIIARVADNRGGKSFTSWNLNRLTLSTIFNQPEIQGKEKNKTLLIHLNFALIASPPSLSLRKQREPNLPSLHSFRHLCGLPDKGLDMTLILKHSPR